MPRDLYDLMLDALRTARAVPVSPAVGTIAPSPSTPVVMTPTWPTAQTVILPDDVAQACETYGFGEREEVSANYRKATELHASGKSAEVIIRTIRNGADVSGLFV